MDLRCTGEGLWCLEIPSSLMVVHCPGMTEVLGLNPPVCGSLLFEASFPTTPRPYEPLPAKTDRTAIFNFFRISKKRKKFEKLLAQCIFLRHVTLISSQHLHPSPTIATIASEVFQVAAGKMGSRRRSIAALGMHDESLAQLDEHDQSFFGTSSATHASAASAASPSGGQVESDEDSSDDDIEPLAQRVDFGQDVEELESDADEIFDSDAEVDVPIVHPPPTAGEEAQQAALIEAELRDWFTLGCKCAGQNHFLALESQRETLVQLITSLKQLNKKSLKQYILGELAASVLPATTAAAERRYRYSVLGAPVCATVFRDVHGVGDHTLKSLKQLVARGIATIPQHGSTKQSPHNIIAPDVVGKTAQFLRSFANIYGLPQPAAPRGRPGAPPIYLPASHKKADVYEKCLSALSELETPAHMSYTSFRRIWKKHVPDVRIMKPRTDVCAHCDRLRQNISRARSEEDTAAAMKKLAEHLEQADEERQYYQSSIASAASDSTESTFSHHTFDFAQQLELPSHTRQVGPLYFLVKYRIQLFGIAGEARHEQWNFLFAEHQAIGVDGKKAHGPNSVISMLHRYLESNPNVKPVLRLHADNCAGQNKNKTVLAYLSWRCATGLSDDVQLSFMRVGHTRCAVDGYFGLIKQLWRKSENDTLEDVKVAVNSSAGPNKAVMFNWPWYEWDTYLAQYFKPLKGITRFQHFAVSKDSPGQVTCKASPSSPATVVKIARDGIDLPTSSEDLPPLLNPPGLSQSRQEYLENNVSQYVSDSAKESLPWL